MLSNLFSFFIGFILLLLIPVIFINHNNDKKLNPYFLIILAIAGLQRFIHGLEVFNIINPLLNPFETSLHFAYFIPPIYYLFFNNLLYKIVSLKKSVLLIGVAIIIVAISIVFKLKKESNQLIFLIYSSTYMIFLLKIIRKYLFNKKNYQEYIHYRSIKIWALIMFTFFTAVFIFANYTFKSYLNQGENIVLNKFNISTSFFFFFLILYILMNPVILYGEQLLQKTLNKPSIDDIVVWKKNKKNFTDRIDLEVEKKVKPNRENLLLSIKKFENSLFDNFTEVPTLKELSIKLEYPQSHIKYIFKYFNNYSFSEYQNVLKIKYALKLIHNNYLSSHTIESLSEKCLFTNRSTFFKNFKNLTGYSPTDYKINIINNS